MKIAIVHDQLLIKGGAERVFLAMAEAFPEADLYTLCYSKENTYAEFNKYRISTSILNRIIRSNAMFRYLFPVSILAMGLIDLSRYDVVLTSSATVAKYIRAPKAKHFCFCYFPTRAIWHGSRYFSKSIAGRLKKFVLEFFQSVDYSAAQRVNHFIAQSETTRAAIEQYYNRSSDIIPSPIDLERFKAYRKSEKQEHFLVVSRLEIWKRVDVAIEAFNQLGLPLRIVGEGADEKRLKNMANDNIAFVGGVSDEDIVREYSSAKAVIFTPELEYGLVPIEANACATPVIAYGVGGVTETMVPWDPDSSREDNEKVTAVFYREQTANSLAQAVQQFGEVTFSTVSLLDNAERYSVRNFQEKIVNYINENV